MSETEYAFDIMLANDLGMDIIAEGIERKEQVTELIKLGCKYGQGYYFSKPLEVKEAEKFIKSKEK